jgi:hypothetical protein
VRLIDQAGDNELADEKIPMASTMSMTVKRASNGTLAVQTATGALDRVRMSGCFGGKFRRRRKLEKSHAIAAPASKMPTSGSTPMSGALTSLVTRIEASTPWNVF